MKGNVVEDVLDKREDEARNIPVFHAPNPPFQWKTVWFYLQFFPKVFLFACIVLALVSAVTELGGGRCSSYCFKVYILTFNYQLLISVYLSKEAY